MNNRSAFSKPHKGVINDWSVTEEQDPYLAPEMRGTLVQGEIVSSGDPKRIRTSMLIDIKGNEIETKNSRYTLGKISETYLAWMKENGIEFDPNVPIRIVAKKTRVPVKRKDEQIANEPW